MPWTPWEIDQGDDLGGLLAESPPVQALIQDPTQIPDLIAIKGLIGKGVAQGSFRIYQDFEFTAYYEVDRPDILHIDGLGKTQRVWLTNKPYRLVHRQTSRNEVDFVDGRITSRTGDDGDAYPVSTEFGPDPSQNCKCPQTTR